LHDEPQRWLHLQDSDLLLYEQPPEITRQGQDVELRFNIPENSAFILLERLGRTGAAPITASL
jgi:hypothetical protein